MKSIILRDPNDNTIEKQGNFWLSFSTWIKEVDYNVTTEEANALYQTYYGKTIPFGIGLGSSGTWEEITEYIELIYEHVVPEEEKPSFTYKVNETLERFNLPYVLKDGHIIESKNVALLPEVQEVDHWLKDYPKAYAPYKSAIEKLESNKYDRNALDDIRLSFEELSRSLTGKTKTLEHLISGHDVEAVLKDKGSATSLRSMVTSLMNYFIMYQDDYVKHHDDVKEEDIEVIVSISCVLMKYLIRMLG